MGGPGGRISLGVVPTACSRPTFVSKAAVGPGAVAIIIPATDHLTGDTLGCMHHQTGQWWNTQQRWPGGWDLWEGQSLLAELKGLLCYATHEDVFFHLAPRNKVTLLPGHHLV